MVTYYPKETSDGSVSVILRFKFNHNTCQDGSFSCSGNCGTESLILSNTNIEQVTGSWCQTERITSRSLRDNSPFNLLYGGSSWFPNNNGIGSWKAVAVVELRIRSDTNKPNSSPQTTIFPVLRVPSNCDRNINLLAFDPDGDEVKCRYADTSLGECESPCTPPPVLSLSSTCTLSFNATSSSNEGSYAVQMVMEDFPRQAITLTQTSGSNIGKTTSDRISRVPIQFTFQARVSASALFQLSPQSRVRRFRCSAVVPVGGSCAPSWLQVLGCWVPSWSQVLNSCSRLLGSALVSSLWLQFSFLVSFSALLLSASFCTLPCFFLQMVGPPPIVAKSNEKAFLQG
ncbi:uncharacterized protein LOC118558490 [Fundulus heteroclitus]|uniref:uncharacterized protein LOC118558490 n=1 Tax=Fundulus heteroclitus TaxID=8078 RepID=UPI00165BAE6F|nr:uncharacterized protein LOC118558490 [Fundulus heteroclitus]